MSDFHPDAIAVSQFLKPCVYALIVGETVMYIGKGSTALRIASSAKEKQCPFTSAQAVFCDTQAQADQLERELIIKLKPPWNKQIPKGNGEPAKFFPGKHPLHKKDFSCQTQVMGDTTLNR